MIPENNSALSRNPSPTLSARKSPLEVPRLLENRIATQ
jgi:hypothetical protein